MSIQNKILVSLASAGVAGSLLISSIAFADTNTNPTTPPAGGWGKGGQMTGRMMGRAPGVVGTVSAISGTTLTVTSKMGPKGGTATTGTTYTVDASSATVTKNGAASTVTAIAVNDTVMVQGTVTGTNVVAKTIRDGIPAKGTRSQNGSAPAPVITGNGQPVIGGSVSAINGNTITVTTAQGSITYIVDATSAKVQKGGITSSVTNITVGDKVVVQGTVNSTSANGTSVTATSIIDQGTGTNAKPSIQGSPEGSEGFMGGIRGFFQHLFGFF